MITKTEASGSVGAERSPYTPLWLVGAGGLLAGELLRLAFGHPTLRLAGAVTRNGTETLDELHPQLGDPSPTIDLRAAVEALGEHLADPEAHAAVVLGLPHAESAPVWKELRGALSGAAERVAVVDLSADYRLRDAAAYRRWYASDHPDPDELASFGYGLPELFRSELAEARRIAAPGCFATALQLACVPAARAGVLAADRAWVLNAVTGSSGSGAKPRATTHHPHRHGNLWAYGLGGHRHEAELLQALQPCGLEPELCFVPHSGPFARGIHLTASLPLARPLSTEDAYAIFAEAYAGEPFVELCVSGVPDLRRVVGSNRAALGVHVKGATLVVLATLDNTIKGGAGQALQCLNLLLGLPETAGLPLAGLGVI